jgi:hypothetical protein
MVYQSTTLNAFCTIFCLACMNIIVIGPPTGYNYMNYCRCVPYFSFMLKTQLLNSFLLTDFIPRSKKMSIIPIGQFCFLGTLFSISIFSDFMKLDDTVVGIISCTSKILASFIFAFATTTTEIYIGNYTFIILNFNYIAS